MPEVSFIIIAFNEEKNIGRCLASIETLNGLDSAEIIVVDDGSKDNTLGVVNQYAKKDSRVRAVPLGFNQGRGAARAAGVKAAKGRYIAFIDADIILPKHWYVTCLSYMSQFDVVGGTATPDADVNYVYDLFDLDPKVLSHTITISGSNGLFKREVFDVVTFDARLRDGEDTVLVHKLKNNGFKLFSIPSLIVQHRESKSFMKSLVWLYEVGKGASRQLKQLRVVRLPDIAALAFFMIAVMSFIASILTMSVYPLALILGFILLTSAIHLYTRFNMRQKDLLKYPFAVLVQSTFIAAYYVGRCAGVVTNQSFNSKQLELLVFFDFEGVLGMPFEAEYDMEAVTKSILETLDRYGVKATFFVVGMLIEERPEILRMIADRGHHIALHGYKHDHIDLYDSDQMHALEANINRVQSRLVELAGRTCEGFRAPFLMSPAYHSVALYEMLYRNGFKWISNRGIRHEREFLYPNRYFFPKVLMRIPAVRTLLFLLLNWRFTVTDSVKEGARVTPISNLFWLMSSMPPFRRSNLVEIPVHAPLDCELVGLPHPSESTPEYIVDYAVDTLIRNVRDAKGAYNITFHDWIVGTGNRSKILERTLSLLSRNQNVKFVTPDEIL